MSKLVNLFLVVGLLFAVTHIVATGLNLYWYYPWFDIVMHFWGGTLITMGTLVLSRLGLLPRSVRRRYILLIAFMFIIGWESFEHIFGVRTAPINVPDTISDILVGFAGVYIGYLLLRKYN